MDLWLQILFGIILVAIAIELAYIGKAISVTNKRLQALLKQSTRNRELGAIAPASEITARSLFPSSLLAQRPIRGRSRAVSRR